MMTGRVRGTIQLLVIVTAFVVVLLLVAGYVDRGNAANVDRIGENFQEQLEG